ncbi:FliM/FliN family flagellar motor switch protein [Sansalvadorimonas sp. 2012CJ34-2]|uniref:Flagellar motor switch protein FliM n=1 Tax=Parendozoicomonas callyspongiae TaxID=2942213 RepID=A0ABT0PFH8_9GAMM|nr:FliM/FliN family flagellar motor switch protein [Sansalvadorimonas sp. 2012CJ34-2]
MIISSAESGAGDIRPCNLFEVGGRMADVRQQAMELSHVCARAVNECLTNMTGEGVEVTAESRYPSTLPRTKKRHVTSFPVKTGSSDEVGLIHLDNALCCALLERACGGEGEIKDSIDLLTHAEHRFAIRLVNLAVEMITKSLGLKEALTISTERDSDKQTAASHNYLLMEMTVTTDNFSGVLSIWLPGEIINPNLEKDENAVSTFKNALFSVPVPITATLSRQKTTLGKVMALKVGDTLPLNLPGIADVHTGKRMLCQARVVTRNGQLAIELESEQKTEEEAVE